MTRINDAGLTTETDLANVAFIPGIRGDSTDVKIPGGLFGSGGGGHFFAPEKEELAIGATPSSHSDFVSNSIYKTSSPVTFAAGDRWDFDFVLYRNTAQAREGVGFMNGSNQSFYLKVEPSGSPRGYTFSGSQNVANADGTYSQIDHTGFHLIRASVWVGSASNVRIQWAYENGIGWADAATFSFVGDVYPFVSTTDRTKCRIAGGEFALT